MSNAIDITVREMVPADWTAVAEIYAQGIATGHATFETEVPSWERWNAKQLAPCRLVSEVSMVIAGWAALSPVSNRPVYSGVAETSIYVDEKHWGSGVGTVLMDHLVRCSEAEGIWTLQSGTFPENEGSIALQKRHGFRVVGVRKRLGCMNGVWRDVVLLERRSDRVGR